jgi:hypothetical protein
VITVVGLAVIPNLAKARRTGLAEAAERS